MEYLPFEKMREKLLLHGRTWSDGERLHFNWTCSGFELTFQGELLLADLCPEHSLEYEGVPGDLTAPTHENWPWVGVYVDGAEVPCRRFEVRRSGKHLLFDPADDAPHTVRVVKLTENLKTFLSVRGLELEGRLLEPPERPEKTVELIGDSITCGFGNEVADPARLFYTQDENGWLSHGALAARTLGMDWRQVCVSGICLGRRVDLPGKYAVNMLYRDTDRPGQEKAGVPVTAWDFRASPADYVVLNLGTNDSTAIAFSASPEAVEAEYDRDYLAFLKLLRACHGEKTHIICAMGSIDYWLYPNILAAVEAYRRETGDRRISTLRYPRISPAGPVGACGHPHVSTHRKMAEALAAHIRGLEQAQEE